MINITISSGASQSTEVYEAFPYGLILYVTDGNGNPSAGVDIDLSVSPGVGGASGIFGGGGPQTYTTVTSGADGLTNSVTVIANGIVGSWEVDIIPWISYTGSTNFELSNLAATGDPFPANVVLVSGGGQSATPSTALGAPLVVQVRDQYGNAYGGGVSVKATAPTSGASGTFGATGTNTQTITTDANGNGTFSAFTVNATLGQFYIQLSSGSLNPDKALVTIAAATSEVCTPQSEMNAFAVTDGGWTNPERWFTGAAQSGTYAAITVDGTNTPASSIVAYTFDQAQLAMIHPDAKITSIECKFWAYTTKTGTYFPNRFAMYPILAGHGSIVRTVASVGNGIAATWGEEGQKFTTFQNTGNTPASNLFGRDLKNPDPATEFQIALQFQGETASNVGGQYRVNGAYVIICYINPDTPDPQYISLQLCEA